MVCVTLFGTIIIIIVSNFYGCFIDSECEANDIRLVNGIISTQNGRVEVCVNGRWGLVCTNNWNNADSRVVCRQLGYGGKLNYEFSTHQNQVHSGTSFRTN